MKLIREHIINEIFKEESDPIHDMDIGISHIFPHILKEIFKYDKDKLFYTIVFNNFFHNSRYHPFNKFIIIHLNNPKMYEFKQLQTNRAIKKYVKDVIFNPKFKYKFIFNDITLEGKYKYYQSSNIYYLKETPLIYIEIKPEINIMQNTVVAQRMGSTSDEIIIHAGR